MNPQRIPVEAVEGLEEVVGRWIARELGPLRASLERLQENAYTVDAALDALRDAIGEERVDRQNLGDELRDAIDRLGRVLDERTERLI